MTPLFALISASNAALFIVLLILYFTTFSYKKQKRLNERFCFALKPGVGGLKVLMGNARPQDVRQQLSALT
jgi:hypothetical protein